MKYRINDSANWQADAYAMVGHLKVGDVVELPHDTAASYVARQLEARDLSDVVLRVNGRQYASEPHARQGATTQLRRGRSDSVVVLQLRERMHELEAERDRLELALQRMQTTATSVAVERDALAQKLDARETSLHAERREVERLRASRDRARQQRDDLHVEVEQLKIAAAARAAGALSDKQRDELQRLRSYSRDLERATLRLVSLLGAVRPQQASQGWGLVDTTIEQLRLLVKSKGKS